MKTRFFKRRKVPISKSNKVAQMGIKVIIKMFCSGNGKKNAIQLWDELPIKEIYLFS